MLDDVDVSRVARTRVPALSLDKKRGRETKFRTKDASRSPRFPVSRRTTEKLSRVRVILVTRHRVTGVRERESERENETMQRSNDFHSASELAVLGDK